MEASPQNHMPDFRTLMEEAEHPAQLEYHCKKCQHDFCAPNNGYSVICPLCKKTDFVILQKLFDPESETGIFQSDGNRERHHTR